VARALDAPVIVLFDDAIERVDGSRRQSLDDFRATVRGLIDQPGHEGSAWPSRTRSSRSRGKPEDLLAIVRRIDHPRVGVNFDADNFYNAGIEPFRMRTSC
jgi:sugar phosphate isomerase/epimerase